VSAAVDATAEIRAFMQAARRMEDKGNLENALELYRQALELAQADPSLRSLAREIELTVQDVEKRVAAQASRPQPAVEIPAPPSVSPLSLGEGPELREQPRRKPGWGFWLLWVLASTAGWAVGNAVFNAVVGAMGSAVRFAVVLAVGGAVGGAVAGVAQWLILRRQVRRAGWWILASTVGWAVGWAVVNAVVNAVVDAVVDAVVGAVVDAVVDAVVGAVGWAVVNAVVNAVVGAVVGAVSGVAQWLILRRQVRRAGWWILASTEGWAVGLAVGSAVDWDMSRAVSSAVIGAVIGAMIGIITGAVLVWLLRQPRREEERKSQPE
jgi:NhaP-type Na+/H+ or K+/H+ antiporter